MKILNELYEAYEDKNYVIMLERSQALTKLLKNKLLNLSSCRDKIQSEEQRIKLAHKVLVDCSKSLNLEEVEIRLNEIKNCQERIEAHQKYIDGLHQ